MVLWALAFFSILQLRNLFSNREYCLFLDTHTYTVRDIPTVILDCSGLLAAVASGVPQRRLRQGRQNVPDLSYLAPAANPVAAPRHLASKRGSQSISYKKKIFFSLCTVQYEILSIQFYQVVFFIVQILIMICIPRLLHQRQLRRCS